MNIDVIYKYQILLNRVFFTKLCDDIQNACILIRGHFTNFPGPSLHSPRVHDVAELASDPPVSVALHLQTWHRSSLATDVVVEAGCSVSGIPKEIVAVVHFSKAVSGGGSVRSTRSTG